MSFNHPTLLEACMSDWIGCYNYDSWSVGHKSHESLVQEMQKNIGVMNKNTHTHTAAERTALILINGGKMSLELDRDADWRHKTPQAEISMIFPLFVLAY